MNTRLLSLLTICASLMVALPASAHDAVRYVYDGLGRLTYMHISPGKYLRYYYDVDSNLVARNIIGLIDTDNDQMDDVWEEAFFGDLSRDGTQDFDADGQSDFAEFVAQTDPVDEKSTLRMLAATTESGATMIIEWDAVVGVNYIVESSSALSSATWTTVAEVVGTASSAQYPVDLTGFGSSHFFRVKVAD